MKLRSTLSKPLAKLIISKRDKAHQNPVKTQQKIFNQLIQIGKKTKFGNDHQFNKIDSVAEFQKRVPIREYEAFTPYIKKIIKGEQDVLWQGQPIYFAKTSGTTSGAKYIPITKQSIHNHIDSARDALLSYINSTGKANFLDGNMMFLSGSPTLEKKGNILTGRLSGISNHHVPQILKTKQLPSWETNCMEDWEQKVDAIVQETLGKDLRLISGIPPWVIMYYDKIVEQTGKAIDATFSNLSLFIYGGVNYEPYRNKLNSYFEKPIDTLETFPASEGFFAYREAPNVEGLLLNIDSGIFYEFIPLNDYHSENPKRLTVAEVELNVNYALIISSNAGLWAYSIGDTVQFVSLKPLRLVVTGRVKHFISAFGEHVIANEVEKALAAGIAKHNCSISEFTVAPKIEVEHGLPHHEWFIEFDFAPINISAFAFEIDKNLQAQNSYYKDLIDGGILQTLKIVPLKKGAFKNYMQSIGKLGGQNKAPRLANDRKIADYLFDFLI